MLEHLGLYAPYGLGFLFGWLGIDNYLTRFDFNALLKIVFKVIAGLAAAILIAIGFRHFANYWIEKDIQHFQSVNEAVQLMEHAPNAYFPEQVAERKIYILREVVILKRKQKINKVYALVADKTVYSRFLKIRPASLDVPARVERELEKSKPNWDLIKSLLIQYETVKVERERNG